MSNIFDDLAKNLAKQGAPVLGGLIGSAIGGPAGTVAGSLAGKAIEALAEQLGTPATPEAVNEAIQSPQAGPIIANAEASASDIVKIYELEVKRAATNDAVEAERGFGTWQMRRTITHYVVLLILFSCFAVSLAASVGLVRGDIALLTVLVGHSVTIFLTWNGLVSGGRAVTNAIAEWRK